MKAKQVMKWMEDYAPYTLSEKDWDNCGLQVGSENKEVKEVLLVLDVTQEAISFAKEKGVQMIISHHPFLFSKIKQIDLDSAKGKMIQNLIGNDICLFSAHTNLDAATRGVSVVLAEKLSLIVEDTLREVQREKLYKLCVYVPKTHEEIIRQALGDGGAGAMGNYSHCSFVTQGTGFFKPLKGSNPYIGGINQLEGVEEVKIEVVLGESQISDILFLLKKVHPYEEVAYDLFSLHTHYQKWGYGCVGRLDREYSLKELARFVKERMQARNVSFCGDENAKIQKIALIGGDGTEFISDAIQKKAEVLITGDIRHHDVQSAREENLNLIDAGHFDTEKWILEELKGYLEQKSGQELSVRIYEPNEFCFTAV